MAALMGHTRSTVFIPGPAGQDTSSNRMTPTTTFPSVIDGTPVRVVVLALSAAVGLVALHAAGFRFSLGVSA